MLQFTSIFFVYVAENICIADIQNMNGQDFIFALQRLGFDNLNKVTGQSFSWMFDYESLQPFLDWFCTELESSNVLELDELEQ